MRDHGYRVEDKKDIIQNAQINFKTHKLLPSPTW